MIDDQVRVIKELTDRVTGWLTPREGEFLYRTARQCSGSGVIVEIGSWKGKSTIWIAAGSKMGSKAKVYAIDPHTGSSDCGKAHSGKSHTFEEFEKNIRSAGVDDIVVPIVKTSEEASKGWSKPVEFLFIDGAHEYEFVAKDFLLWFPQLIEGGTIALDDTTACLRGRLGGFAGPKMVVDRFIFRSRELKDVGLVDTPTYPLKCASNQLKDRMRTRYVRFLKLFSDFEGILLRRLPSRIKAAGRRIITGTSASGT